MSSAGNENAGRVKNSEELRLSRQEAAAAGAAEKLAGRKPSTQRALASIVLGFELIIVLLLGLSLFGLAVLSPRELGLWLGGFFMVLIALALGLMRFGKLGIILGWVVHVLLLACAFLLPASLVASVLFGALWVYCMVKGAQIDRDRAALTLES